jgi:hypothetical protein
MGQVDTRCNHIRLVLSPQDPIRPGLSVSTRKPSNLVDLPGPCPKTFLYKVGYSCLDCCPLPPLRVMITPSPGFR